MLGHSQPHDLSLSQKKKFRSLPTKDINISPLNNAEMGTGKKEKNRKIREGKVGDGFGNVKVKGENFYRSAKKVKALNILTKGTAQHNARGEQTKAAAFQSRQVPQARVEPNRKVGILEFVGCIKLIETVVHQLPGNWPRCSQQLPRSNGRASLRSL